MENEAIFAAGCFWGVEAAFQKTSGVISTGVGYTGGHTQSPTYKQVCSGKSGHAEAVKVTFNKDEISYSALLDIFWKRHDPTQLNRQGVDIGSQYRSAIFYTNDEQREIAEESKAREAKKYRVSIATEIVAADVFWLAEDYHQSYVKKQRGDF